VCLLQHRPTVTAIGMPRHLLQSSNPIHFGQRTALANHAGDFQPQRAGFPDCHPNHAVIQRPIHEGAIQRHQLLGQRQCPHWLARQDITFNILGDSTQDTRHLIEVSVVDEPIVAANPPDPQRNALHSRLWAREIVDPGSNCFAVVRQSLNQRPQLIARQRAQSHRQGGRAASIAQKVHQGIISKRKAERSVSDIRALIWGASGNLKRPRRSKLRSAKIASLARSERAINGLGRD
jgi:hypothetical protein